MRVSRLPRKVFGYILIAIFSTFIGIYVCPNQVITPAYAASSESLSTKSFNKNFNDVSQYGFKKVQDGAVVGSLQGNLTITPSGQANYVIPITVPPGTNKMEPSLGITYDSTNSNIRNGLLGMGFSLEGLTSITRCPCDKAHNGKIHGVDFSDQDRFCLNGQQLVAVKGTYGQDGTEYRTYEDTQTRIISHGRQGNGPASFTVETKGGQTAIYGGTAESQNRAQGKDTVASWGLSKIKDRVGNYIDVHYFNDSGNNGIFYPTEVNYTGNEKIRMAPYNSVKLIYEDRSDIRTSYKAGSKSTINKRLKTIETYQSNQLVYSYRFNYEISPNTFRSRITSIQKCDGDGNCLPPTKFEWQTNEEGWVKAPQFIPHIPIVTKNYDDNGVRFVDINGDGLVDIMYAKDLSGPEYGGVWINTGNGWQKIATDLFPRGFVDPKGNDFGTRLVDLNGDGLAELIHAAEQDMTPVANDAWRLNIKTGAFEELPQYKMPVNIVYGIYGEHSDDNGVRFVDINGDGLVDIMYGKDLGGPENGGVWINTGNGWQNTTSIPPRGFVDPKWDGRGKDFGTRLVDLNGDGIAELIHAAGPEQDGTQWANDAWRFNIDTGVFIELSQYKMPDNIDKKPVNITYGKQGDDNGVRFVDINRDGLVDIMYGKDLGGPENGGVWINTGNGWQKIGGILPRGFVDPKGDGRGKDFGTRLVDLNGDGIAELIHAAGHEQDGTQWANDAWRFNINTGAFEELSKYKMPDNVTIVATKDGKDNGVRFVDLTSTGLPDLVYNNEKSSGAYLNRAQKLPDYLISITDGLGTKTKIDYEPLSGKKVKVYTKEHNAQYPNMDWQGPMYVVYQTISDANISDPKAKNRVLAKAGFNSNNQNATNTLHHVTTYHYTGAKFNHLGFGFLGFHQISTKDETTGITKIVTYGQDPTQHNVGKELTTATYTKEGTLIHTTSNEYRFKTFGDGTVNKSYYLSYIKTASENGYSTL